MAYDFQGVGEYVLFSNSSMTVQVRQQRYGTTPTAVQVAAAIGISGDRVGFYLKSATETRSDTTLKALDQALVAVEPPPPVEGDGNQGGPIQLRVNGLPVELHVGEMTYLPRGGRIERDGSSFHVTSADGSLVARIRAPGRFLSVSVRARGPSGPAEGLFGNGNGDALDDLKTRGGEVLGRSVTFRDLYGTYGDSWRVTSAESLFDYEAGESTESFVDRGFPPFQMQLSYLGVGERESARQICIDAGIDQGYWLESCTLDVALTSDSDFARAFNAHGAPLEAVSVIEDTGTGERGLAWAAQRVGRGGGASDTNYASSSTREGCSCTLPGAQAGSRSSSRLGLLHVGTFLAACLLTRRRLRRSADSQRELAKRK